MATLAQLVDELTERLQRERAQHRAFRRIVFGAGFMAAAVARGLGTDAWPIAAVGAGYQAWGLIVLRRVT